MIALLLVPLMVQTGGWTVSPARPTVGDTIRVERTIETPAGWRVRAGKLDQYGDVEQLGEPSIVARPGGWTVRYLIVGWRAGGASVAMPSLWRLGPDGSTDSLPGGTVTLRLASVIPDTLAAPQPQPSLGILRLGRGSAIPVIAAVGVSIGLLFGLIAWRRRASRLVAADLALARDAEVPDQRWLAAGEPKAVAARAAQRLRHALARAIPAAHEALSTTEVLAAVERARPDAPLRDLRDLLHALDQVAFATGHGVDVAPLAARARTLARELRPNGGSARK
ncbi:MAG: hypothetical protein ACM358_17945 [Gemmatimonadota bacterium]